jgi:methionyl-tRNA formyltransferase
MHDYFEKNKTYEGLFDKVSSIKNKTVIQHLENIHQQYEKYEAQKNELDFYEKVKDKA